MLTEQRNYLKYDGWLLKPVDKYESLKQFNCGKADLNDFFQNDVYLQKQELLNETYELTEATIGKDFPVALISLCNDAIRKEKLFPYLPFKGTKKDYPVYPAVKIARFGVKNDFRRKNIGTLAINIIKTLFLTNNRTGCRFVTVDAYNESDVLNFYNKNGFQFFSERDKNKDTRAMFYDLKRIKL
ncbi:MAG: GNAT family N-acetyltransferase [Deltaproteobacteria bacterium HGW-Deltaproteobacteria-1]|jgi:GNAT superfamily N-acetyltransferase|nr:MAG: GNAT family N-acetyltransferase [Deltaproteobacteria bacterium HGW-Deltaproteobacteria-1]